MNSVNLVGRLTAKPELRYTNSNIPYTRFSVAIDGIPSSNGERRTDFINNIAWRKQAENICQYLDKGSLVAVTGRLQTNNYTDKDGNKRYSMEVSADNVRFLESKSKTQSNNTTTPYDFQQPSNNNVNVDSDPFADFGDSVSIDDNFLD